MIDVPEQYEKALRFIRSQSRQCRIGIIGVDGRSGAGKTRFSHWLAWHLECPVVHLDLLLQAEHTPRRLQWRTDCLTAILDGRALKAPDACRKTVIIEGLGLRDALRDADEWPDLVVHLAPRAARTDPGGPIDQEFYRPYRYRWRRLVKPDFVMCWRMKLPPPDLSRLEQLCQLSSESTED